MALNLTPLKYQKIHWRSVPGSGSLGSLEVQNRGQIRFMKKEPGKCSVKLTISYEVPNVLAPFASVSERREQHFSLSTNNTNTNRKLLFLSSEFLASIMVFQFVCSY